MQPQQTPQPAPLAALRRYCAAYRLGSIGDVLSAGGPTAVGGVANPQVQGWPLSVAKTADGGGSPMVQWSAEERRWCAYLHWSVMSVFSGPTQRGNTVDFRMNDAGWVVSHILSFVEVTPKLTHTIKFRSGKRARPSDATAVSDGNADDESERGRLEGSAPSEEEAPSPAKPPTASQLNPSLYSRATAKTSDEALLPLFYVSPPFTDAVQLFVRMSSTVTLTDEELNHLFGRYGMISARRVGGRGSGSGGAAPEATGGESALSLRGSRHHEGGGDASPSRRGAVDSAVHDGGAGEVDAGGDYSHLQNFIVTLDVNRNCLRAIQEVRQPEIIFIAFSRPERNAYCVADLPRSSSRMHALLGAAIAYRMGTPDFAHVVASLRLAQGGALTDADGDGGDGSKRASTELSLASGFIPDLVVDHLPYWTTREQLKARFALHGTIRKLRLGVDDRNGSFMGTALVGMGSLQESITASEALHGVEIDEGWPMTVGVLNEHLSIVALRSGEVLAECEDPVGAANMGVDVAGQHRMWL